MVFDLVTSDDDVTIPNKHTNRQTDFVKESRYRMFLEPIVAKISQHSKNWLSKFTYNVEVSSSARNAKQRKSPDVISSSTAERSLGVFDFFYCLYPIMKLH